jgi:hypothetical protein
MSVKRMSTRWRADGVESEGADIFHADPLRDEGEAPDGRGKQQQKIGA